ncbi:unnamed protein product [Strongylus vulgaris]|uniref:Uncharacterized protein n=1 Tax=Strongylus vulgaris TaxID=40348 RepID=A0A3P7JBW4_STRVU|nr:unnamed protein product [Strongylus vulgaris]
MTVDETCSPIFVGVPDEDLLQPTSNTSIQMKPAIQMKPVLSKSPTQPISANTPDEADHVVTDQRIPAIDEPDYTEPLATVNHSIQSEYTQSTQPQPISVNLPDESDDLQPVRELIQERIQGAPTLVSLKSKIYIHELSKNT